MRLRDDKTAAPQTPRRPPPHIAGLLPRTPQKTPYSPLTLRVVFPPKAPTTLLYCGSSFALRVGFYLPERFRELGTTRRQDSRTPNASPLPPHCGTPHALFHQKAPHSLRSMSLCASPNILRLVCGEPVVAAVYLGGEWYAQLRDALHSSLDNRLYPLQLAL